MDRRPAGDQAGAVSRLVFAEPGAVHDPGQDLAGIDRDPEVGRGEAQQFLAIVERFIGRAARPGPELAPPEVGHDLAADAQAVTFVDGELVAEAGHLGVHPRAAELLVVGVLAGGHLHQRRAAEEHLGLPVDQHRVVAHAGHVGASRGGVTEHQRDGRDAGGRELGELLEDLAGVDEQLGLGGQVGSAGLDQVDHRQPVDPGDVQGPQVLLQGERVHGTAAHGRVVRDDHALHAADHADPGEDAGPDGELAPPGRERGQFQEGGIPVEQQFQPLAHQQPAALVVPPRVPLAASRPDQVELLLQCRQRLQLDPAVVPVCLVRGVERGLQNGHRRLPQARERARRPVRALAVAIQLSE